MLGLSSSSFASVATATDLAKMSIQSKEFNERLQNGETVLIDMEEIASCDSEPCPEVYAGAFLGNSMGVNVEFKPNARLVLEAGMQFTILPSSDFKDTDITSPIAGGFSGAVRYSMFNDYLEVGARYQPTKLSLLTEKFKQEFSNIGYDVQVNLYKEAGGKIYLGISSTTTSLEPTTFRIGGIFKLN